MCKCASVQAQRNSNSSFFLYFSFRKLCEEIFFFVSCLFIVCCLFRWNIVHIGEYRIAFHSKNLSQFRGKGERDGKQIKPFNSRKNFLACSVLFQIENQDDGIRIIHILGVEHRHSGEVQCLAYNSLNPSATQRSSYTELAVLPRPIQLTNLDVDINDAVPPFEANAVNKSTEAITNATTSAVDQQKYKQIADVPAYLIRGPDDCIALVGGNVSLTVTYGGHPIPTIKWLRAVSNFIHLLF